MRQHHHQIRRWTSWHRFVTLAMVALAYLAVLAATQPSPGSPTDATTADTSNTNRTLPDPRLPIPQTLAELRHLIAHLIITPALDATHLMHWSTWRRRHQAVARYCHYRRRLTT